MKIIETCPAQVLRRLLCLLSVITSVTTSVAVAEVVVTAREVPGSYTYTHGDAVYEAFALAADGEFTAWLHQRLDSSGTWSIQGNTITVQEQAGHVQRMTVKSISNSGMVLRYEGMNSDAHYRKH